MRPRAARTRGVVVIADFEQQRASRGSAPRAPSRRASASRSAACAGRSCGARARAARTPGGARPRAARDGAAASAPQIGRRLEHDQPDRRRPAHPRRRCCEGGSAAGGADELGQRREPRVELVDAGEVVQHALVDAQRRRGERRRPAPSSISRQRRSGAPGVSALQCGSASAASASAEGRRAQAVPLRAHRRRCRVSSSTPAQSSSRSRSNGDRPKASTTRSSAAGWATGPAARVGLAGERRLQPRCDAVELGGQRHLVLGDPVAHSATFGSA